MSRQATKATTGSSHTTFTSRHRRTTRIRDSEAERVMALVARDRSVPLALLRHHTRCRAPVAEARQIAMYLIHTLLGRTMTAVGGYFGRDRTTVAHACGRIEDRRDDRWFDAEVTALEDEVLGSAEPAANDTGASCHARP